MRNIWHLCWPWVCVHIEIQISIGFENVGKIGVKSPCVWYFQNLALSYDQTLLTSSKEMMHFGPTFNYLGTPNPMYSWEDDSIRKMHRAFELWKGVGGLAKVQKCADVI